MMKPTQLCDEAASQCQIEIAVFRQNYLYKTIEKVATINNAFLVFSSTLQEHHIFVILPNILLYFRFQLYALDTIKETYKETSISL